METVERQMAGLWHFPDQGDGPGHDEPSLVGNLESCARANVLVLTGTVALWLTWGFHGRADGGDRESFQRP